MAAPGPPHVTLVEEGSRGGCGAAARPETARRALCSATVTLTLAILGSSVLPIPYAFSRLGLFPGLATMLAVAGANALAGTLLLRCAGSLHKHTFESLAEEVGGPSWKLATEICLVLLLWGNLTGDFCLLADMGVIAARDLFPGGAPAWLVAGDGRFVMTALAVLVVFPLSCLRHMRELEAAATAGVLFVVALAAVFITCSVSAGLPAVASGELPLFKPAVAANLPEAIGLLSFAFYLAPMLLPMLGEMPAGRLGVDLTCKATQIVTVGVACACYAVIGFFAAARYGLQTEGDVLVNQWLPGRWDGVLDACMTVYLSICMAPMAMTLRYQLENLLVGEGGALPRTRQVLLTALSLLSCLLLALAFPNQAEKMFAVTGATAVCAVCYVLPIAIHLKLYLRGCTACWWAPGSGSSLGGGKNSKAKQRRRRHPSFSFDPGQAALLPAGRLWGGGGGGGGTDLSWLLSADHHATAAALHGTAASQQLHPSVAADLSEQLHPSLAAAFPRQVGDLGRGQLLAAGVAPVVGEQPNAGQQPTVHGAEWVEGLRQEAWEERPNGGAMAARLGGHRWTDLSLNRWLRGQSFDSMGGALPDSQPNTPVSPSGASSRHGGGAGGGQGSMGSPRGVEHLCSGNDNEELAGRPGGDWEQQGLEERHLQEQQQQQQQLNHQLEQQAQEQQRLKQQQLYQNPQYQQQPQYHLHQHHSQQQQQQQQERMLPWASPDAVVLVSTQGLGREAVPMLPAVPESASSLAGAERFTGGTIDYPCLSDAGIGVAKLVPLLQYLVLPTAVLVLGVASSLSALYLALAGMLN